MFVMLPSSRSCVVPQTKGHHELGGTWTSFGVTDHVW